MTDTLTDQAQLIRSANRKAQGADAACARFDIRRDSWNRMFSGKKPMPDGLRREIQEYLQS